MLLSMFRDNGSFIEEFALVYRYDALSNTVFITDCRAGKEPVPVWINLTSAIQIIEDYKLPVINRSGQCLTFSKEF